LALCCCLLLASAAGTTPFLSAMLHFVCWLISKASLHGLLHPFLCVCSCCLRLSVCSSADGKPALSRIYRLPTPRPAVSRGRNVGADQHADRPEPAVEASPHELLLKKLHRASAAHPEAQPEVDAGINTYIKHALIQTYTTTIRVHTQTYCTSTYMQHTCKHAGNTYTYMHAYKHTNIHTYIHTNVHTYMHACSMHVCIHTDVQTYMHVACINQKNHGNIHAFVHKYTGTLTTYTHVIECRREQAQ